MAHLLRVDGPDATGCERTSMVEEGLTETAHLESWIKTHLDVIDDGLMVVTTQFSTWASETDTARERPDVLALSTSGELVFIELKRGSDRNVHLQAITYGALVAGGYQPGQGLDGRRCDPKAGDVEPRPNSAAALGEGTRQELDTLRFAERDFQEGRLSGAIVFSR